MDTRPCGRPDCLLRQLLSGGADFDEPVDFLERLMSCSDWRRLFLSSIGALDARARVRSKAGSLPRAQAERILLAHGFAPSQARSAMAAMGWPSEDAPATSTRATPFPC